MTEGWRFLARSESLFEMTKAFDGLFAEVDSRYRHSGMTD
jgi:hypothetical protein